MAEVRLHEHVEGEHWPLLSAAQKLAVVEQLNLMVSSMRSLKQSPWNTYIGLFLAALGQFTIDLSGSASWAHPFDSVKAFADQLFYLGRGLPCYPDPPRITSRGQAWMCRFAPANAMMSSTSTENLAIIDWYDAGCYPEFWEYIMFWLADCCSACLR